MKNGYIQKCKYNCECAPDKNVYESPSLYRIFSKNCYKKINNKIIKKKNSDGEYIYSMTIAPNTYECTNMQSTSITHEKDNCINCCLHSKPINHKRIKQFNEQNNKTHPIDGKWDDPKRYIQEFGDRTTFHGVRDFFYSRTGFSRVTWICIISIALLATLQGCYLIVEEFIKRPVIVSYLTAEADRKGLLLPDVVICPFNRFNRSYFSSLNISDGLAQYLELSYPSPVIHSFQMRQYKATIRRMDEYDEELTKLLEKIGNLTFSQFIKKSAIDCNAFFDNQNVCKNLSEIMTSAGKCFRFPGIIQEGDGFGYGARFVIKLPQNLYNPGVNQMLIDGIAVKLAEKNRGIDHDLSFIPSANLGVHAIMPLSATRYEFINDPPRYKCEKNIKSTYSRVWCFEMCLTERAELKCNCSLAASQAVLSLPRTQQICTTRQFYKCYAPEIFHKNSTYEIERCKAQCKPPCTYWDYRKTISYAHFPSEQAKFFVESEDELKKLKHTIILEVYYTNLDYTIIRHYYAMTLSGLLAQIGGQISLWIGGSIISLIQLFFYISGTGYIILKKNFFSKKQNIDFNLVVYGNGEKHNCVDINGNKSETRRRLSSIHL